MKFIKQHFYKLILITFLFIMPLVSFAQSGTFPPEPSGTFPSDPNAGKIMDPLKGRFHSIPELIKGILEGVLKIGIPIVALAIIYCGFLFVAARGKPEAITKAKSALLYTLIGAAILLGSWAIAELIAHTVTGLS